MDAAAQAALLALITKLAGRPEAEPFRRPVSWREEGLTDYPRIVKRPMDLDTLRRGLEAGAYASPAACLDDLQLIWDNCKLYNQDGSKIHKVARRLEEATRRAVDARFGPELRYGGNNPSFRLLEEQAEGDLAEELSYVEKARFAREAKQLGPAQLSELVERLRHRAPRAFHQLDGENYQIIVDFLPRQAFAELQSFLDEALRGQAKRAKQR